MVDGQVYGFMLRVGVVRPARPAIGSSRLDVPESRQ
jgi:hypothetical protein